MLLRRSTTRIASQIYKRFGVATFCDKASSSSSDSSSSSSRLHSTDIAFKPAESGWGSSKQYGDKWENIFGNSSETKTEKNEDKWHDKVLSIEREIQALPQDIRETLLKKFI